jgi:hypothetical protein
MAILFAIASTLGIWALMSALDRRAPQPAPEPVVQLAPEPIPKLEPNTDPNAVDVLITKEDLPAGTTITPRNIAKFVSWKRIAKDACPDTAVTDENRLHNMRFWRPLRKGEIIGSFDVHSQTLRVPEGKELLAIEYSVPPLGGMTYFPGSYYAICATVRYEKRLESFIVVRDTAMLTAYYSGGRTAHTLFAVNSKEKELMEFALTRECSWELILHHPDEPPHTEPVDLDGVKKRLEEIPLKKPTRPQ